ncbi:MAG TPA: DUF805 domain-containing protein [Caulobacteraceae bacterium]|nr:DUF805 domain-containing protein [Caulobacteraceae bacterium]
MTLWQTLFGFQGRIGRSVFWLALLAVALLDLAVAALVSDWIHARYVEAGVAPQPGRALFVMTTGFLAAAAVSVWIGLALKVKRAHDVDHSGWWLAIALVPVYGPIRLLIDLGFRPGSKRRNRFGPPMGDFGDLDDRDDAGTGASGPPPSAEPPAPNVPGSTLPVRLEMARAQRTDALARRPKPALHPANDVLVR